MSIKNGNGKISAYEKNFNVRGKAMNNSIYGKRYRLISPFLIAMLLTGCSSSQLSLGNKESDDSEEEISENVKDADDEAASC